MLHLDVPTDSEISLALTKKSRGLPYWCMTWQLFATPLLLRTSARAIPIVASIFDRTIGEELKLLLPHVVVTSPAVLAAPVLAGQELNPLSLALSQAAGSWRIAVETESDGSLRGVPVDLPRTRRIHRNCVTWSPWRALEPAWRPHVDHLGARPLPHPDGRLPMARSPAPWLCPP